MFTGVGLVEKGIVIFSWFDRISSIIKDYIEEAFTNEIKDDKLKTRTTLRVVKSLTIENKEWKLHIWVPPLDDGKIAYSVCCKNDDFPERLIYSYLRELNKSTLRIERINENRSPLGKNELNKIKEFKQDIKNLITQYDDFEHFDKISRLEETACEIANTIQDNIHILLNNKGILEALDDQAEVLEDETEIFLSESIQVKKRFWWKNMKYTFILIGIVSLIIIIVLANLVNTFFGNGLNLAHLLKSNENSSSNNKVQISI
ncbi:Synaptobrevin family protein [Cryptosporidium felis]|nr:Synaptobrevin family protein [Cryptosporidium felis]